MGRIEYKKQKMEELKRKRKKENKCVTKKINGQNNKETQRTNTTSPEKTPETQPNKTSSENPEAPEENTTSPEETPETQSNKTSSENPENETQENPEAPEDNTTSPEETPETQPNKTSSQNPENETQEAPEENSTSEETPETQSNKTSSENPENETQENPEAPEDNTTSPEETPETQPNKTSSQNPENETQEAPEENATDQESFATNPISFTRVVDGTPSEIQGTKSCPSSRPFYNKKECINCYDPTPLFNQTSGECTACKEGQVFIYHNHKCQPKQQENTEQEKEYKNETQQAPEETPETQPNKTSSENPENETQENPEAPEDNTTSPEETPETQPNKTSSENPENETQENPEAPEDNTTSPETQPNKTSSQNPENETQDNPEAPEDNTTSPEETPETQPNKTSSENPENETQEAPEENSTSEETPETQPNKTSSENPENETQENPEAPEDNTTSPEETPETQPNKTSSQNPDENTTSEETPETQPNKTSSENPENETQENPEAPEDNTTSPEETPETQPNKTSSQNPENETQEAPEENSTSEETPETQSNKTSSENPENETQENPEAPEDNTTSPEETPETQPNKTSSQNPENETQEAPEENATDQESFATNPISFTRVVDGTPSEIQGTKSCPSSRPFYNKKECINCYDPTPLFNQTSGECTACKEGQVFIYHNHKCQSQQTSVTSEEQPIEPLPVVPTASSLSSFNRIVDGEPVANSETPCPESTPFFAESQCVECSDPTPIFNISSLSCTKCPDGTVFIASLHRCSSKFSSEPSETNDSKQTSDTSEEQPIEPLPVVPTASSPSSFNRIVDGEPVANSETPCPESTPFFAESQCVECSDPTPIFNISSLSCTKCPDGTVFIASLHRCSSKFSSEPSETNDSKQTSDTSEEQPIEPLPVVPTASSPSSFNRIVDGEPVANSETPCPESTPFFAESQCVECSDPTPIFNISSLSCTKCPDGTVFIASLHRCSSKFSSEPSETNDSKQTSANQNIPDEVSPQTPTYNMSNPIASDFINGEESPVQNGNPCPSETPFFNAKTQTCVICQDPTPYFELQTYSCSFCPQEQTFDVDSRSCHSLVSNFSAPNWKAKYPFSTASRTAADAKDNKKLYCPSETPFFNGISCISCEEGSYFDADKKICEPCKNGEEYDSKLKKCIPLIKKNTTNPTTPSNLIYSGMSSGQVLYNYENEMQSSESLGDCLEPTPYYNGRQCISCPDDYPYFDLIQKDCVVCSPGNEYNPEKHECYDNSGVAEQPSLARMAVTAFAHHDTTQTRHRIGQLRRNA